MNDTVAIRRELYDSVRAILLGEWDPVRIAEMPDAVRAANTDEYDDYVAPVADMIARRAPEARLAAYLAEVERRAMGIQPRHSRAAVAAGLLFALEDRFGI